MKNKKAEDESLLNSAVMFIVIVLVFFAAMIFFVSRAGSGAGVYEQIYAKKIALVIDQLKPGMNVSMDIKELYSIADKNNINRLDTIKIDNEKKQVYVQISQAKGYTYSYFTDYNILWNLQKKINEIGIRGEKWIKKQVRDI